MATITGVNNPGNGAHVDSGGRVGTSAVSNSEQDEAAINGDSYNLNTDVLTLTTAAETPIFYVKNESSDEPMKISRVFISLGTSTGGSGPVLARVVKNLTGGTILTGTALELSNFNFGIGKEAKAVAKLGGTGVTAVGIETSIKFLFPTDTQRALVSFDSIILPRGSSMALLITPPAGNTSMPVEAGVNIFERVSRE